ncbi:DNA-binding protein [Candidatus Pacearchaeota archaeon]|nr:DNA-binding protein [Candidatus Pacearchaeota archaeon]
MKISELKVGQGRVEVSGIVKKISDTRVFNKYGRELKVADAILEDDSGAIKLALWNDDITKIKEGDKIKITNGFVNEFQAEKQLTAGKYGKIEVVK